MTDKKRYTIMTEDGMTQVVAKTKVEAYKTAIGNMLGNLALSDVPEQITLEIEKVEVQKPKWVEKE